MFTMKTLLVASVAVADASAVCPFCERAVSSAAAQGASQATQAADTTTVRMRITGMTCATCQVTARVALKKLDGVYDATVTYDDSLAVVRYDQKRVNAAQIASHLTRLTGYKANVIPDSSAVTRRPGLAEWR
jgi:mercuric ion binding protein